MNRVHFSCLYRKGFDMNVIEVKHQTPRVLLDDIKGHLRINRLPNTPLHNHIYCEIHIITEGEAIFTMSGKEYLVPKNHAILIPPHVYHAVDAKDGAISRIAFYSEHGAENVVCKQIASGLIEEIYQKTQAKADISSIYNHLFFILNELISLKELKICPLNDHKLQIREFFSLNYAKKITLGDLAKELQLSEMQTQRVIKKHTGKTFGENLLFQRMTVAENLMKTTEMTLAEIAEYIGYHSYCGFWKAYQKWRR